MKKRVAKKIAQDNLTIDDYLLLGSSAQSRQMGKHVARIVFELRKNPKWLFLREKDLSDLLAIVYSLGEREAKIR